MAGYASVREKKNQLLRKARDGSVFIAPYSATAITALTTGASADLAPLPATYEDLGWTSTDGVTYARSTNVSDINSFGASEPTRSDITTDTITMQVTAQQTSKLVIGLTTGADVSSLQATMTTGETAIAKPARPSARYHRVLGLFVDYADDGDEIYIARFMPRARITAIADQQYNDGDSPIQVQLTFTGYEDATLGYSHKWIWGGPGWLSLLADMDITLATT